MPLRLENIAAALPHDAGNNFLGFKVQCHQATLIWLYHATYGALPAKLDDILPKLGRYAEIMAKMAKRGVQLKVSSRYDKLLVPGSVLIFEQDGAAMHSCVVKAADKIVGYNQMNWFREQGNRAKGVGSSYSEHASVDIDWVQPFPSEKVTGALNRICRLMMVPAGAALEEFQR